MSPSLVPPQRIKEGVRPPIWILPQGYERRINAAKCRPEGAVSEFSRDPAFLRRAEDLRGYPKGGGRPPLCRRGRGGHGGETPSKGFLLPCGFSVHFWASKSEPRGAGVRSPRKAKCRTVKESAETPSRQKEMRDLEWSRISFLKNFSVCCTKTCNFWGIAAYG